MKHLLVIAESVKSKNSALKRALELQAKSGAKITLLGFCYASVGHTENAQTNKLSRKELERALIKQRESELKTIAREHKIKTRKFALKVLWGKPTVPAINAFCNQQNIDMLIKAGTQKKSWLHTSTDWQLFRECPAPVMVTTGKSWKKKSRILIAVDFSTGVKSKQKLNDKLVEQAKVLADVLEDELHIAFALSIPEPLADLDLINPRKYAAEKKKRLQPIVKAFCEKHELKPEHVHIRQGNPDKIIPSIASKLKADLVIAGTVGRKGVKGKLLGNTAEGILSKLYTDILAVKP